MRAPPPNALRRAADRNGLRAHVRRDGGLVRSRRYMFNCAAAGMGNAAKGETMIRFLVGALVAMLIGAAPAAAHVVVKSSSIEQGGVYGAALGNPVPEKLEITFNGDVGLAELRLETEAGEPVGLDFVKPKVFQASFVIPLPALAAGQYVFHWRALAKDGHAMNGKIEFSVE